MEESYEPPVRSSGSGARYHVYSGGATAHNPVLVLPDGVRRPVGEGRRLELGWE